MIYWIILQSASRLLIREAAWMTGFNQIFTFSMANAESTAFHPFCSMKEVCGEMCNMLG